MTPKPHVYQADASYLSCSICSLPKRHPCHDLPQPEPQTHDEASDIHASLPCSAPGVGTPTPTQPSPAERHEPRGGPPLMTDTVTHPVRRVPVRFTGGRLVPTRDRRHLPAQSFIHCDAEGRPVELGQDGTWHHSRFAPVQPDAVLRYWQHEAEQEAAADAERKRQLRLRAEARGEQ